MRSPAADQSSEQRTANKRRLDWIRIAFTLAVILLVAVGVFMTLAVSAEA